MIISKKNLTDIMTASKNISNEVCIDADDERLMIQAVDPAHVAMMSLSIPHDEYQADVPVKMQVDTKIILDSIKMCDKDDNVNMSINEGHITIQAGRYTRMTPEIDEANVPAIPPIEMPISFSVDSSLIRDAIKASASVSDVFRIECDDTDNIRIHSEQADGRESMSVSVPISESTHIPGRGNYPLDYVKDIFSAVSGRVEMSFNSDYPAKVEASICDTGKIMFILAPRIEND